MNTRGTGNQVSLRAVFSFLVILVMMMLSAGGAAAEQTEAHTHEGWTAVEALPTESGSYYLTKDIEITSAWKISSGMNITLCLNDHSITMTAAGLGIIIDGGTLNLYDCGTTAHSYTTDTWPAVIGSGSGTFTGGYITHAAGKNGPAIRMNKGGFNMYGGTLIGNNNVSDQYYSGAVDMAAGTFNLYNGTIAGNQGSRRLGGGAVYKTGGTMNIYGGEIRHNYAESGGGVLSYGGTTIMRDGSIHHNTGYAAGGFFIAEGTVSMSGGSIADNSATNIGGMVVNGTFNMSGGSITGNTDSSDYGCICIGGTMNLSGGSIKGNTSKYGAVKDVGTLYISGNPVVTGNKAPNGNEMNVYLPGGKTVLVTGAMTSGASVGITTETAPTAGNPVKFGVKYKTNNTESPDKWFFSDNGFDVLVMNDTADQDAYIAAKVTLTYDGNGADSGDVPAAQTVTHGTAVTVAGAGTLKKAGSIFDHWTTVPEEGRNTFAPGDEISLEGNKTLYASWLTGYTVTWQNGDGSVLDEKEVKEGDPQPTTDKIPAKKPDEQYTYTFTGWAEPVIDENGNRVYKPEFSTQPREYTVTFADDDGSPLKEITVEYGKTPVVQPPEKRETETSIYTFAGWSDGMNTYPPDAELPAVKKDVTYKAMYTVTAKPTAAPVPGLAAAPTASPTVIPTATPKVTAAPTAAPEPTATPKPVPKTGDREDVLLWAEILALCLAMLVVLRAVRSGQRRKQ